MKHNLIHRCYFLFICKHESADCVTNRHKIHKRIILFSYWWVIKSLKCKLKPKQNLISLIKLLKNDSLYTQTLKPVPLLSCYGGISLGLQKVLLKLNQALLQWWLCAVREAGQDISRTNEGCSWLECFNLALCVQGVIYGLVLIVNFTFSSQLSLTLHWSTPGDDFRDFPGCQN